MREKEQGTRVTPVHPSFSAMRRLRRFTGSPCKVLRGMLCAMRAAGRHRAHRARTRSGSGCGRTGLAALGIGLLTHLGQATTIQEDFSTDPAPHGWQIFGENTLFAWDDTNQALRVTWDSSKTNSYFHLPLNNTLTRAESFEASFDLKLEDIATGITPGKPYTFQIAVCLFDIEAAKRTNFLVGTGTSPSSGPRSTVEFNYFPGYEDPIYGDITETFALIVVPTNTNPFLYDHDFPRPLDAGVWHRINLSYNASNQTATLSKTRAGAPYGLIQSIPLTGGFSNFEINTFAIASYSDTAGLGSVLAHGWIDNVSITVPDPPVSSVWLSLTNGFQAQVHFQSASEWTYALERSQDLLIWSTASATMPGDDGLMTLMDTNPPTDHAFYRVRAER